MTQTDEQLLDAIAVLYTAVDPAPTDLADGVLARLAIEDLETDYELLTLVESVDHASGTRGPTGVAAPGDDTTVALEFAGTSYRVLLRISTVDGHRRLDGWVVPSVPLLVSLGREGSDEVRQSVESDADGRFELPDPMTGQVRLWLTPQATDESGLLIAPFVTPLFLL